MGYPLSATKLRTYQQCPQAYYFKHERRLPAPATFGSAALGKALHHALADIYQDWNYAEPLPSLDWFALCWQQQTGDLNETQVEEGWHALQRYYETFVAPLPMMGRPLGVEGKIQATFQACNVEFALTGRYDRLDYVDDGLELIDYKTSKTIAPTDTIDLQLGLYYLILEQTYHQALKRLSLIYLRLGQRVSFEVTPDHQRQVQTLIGELALKLRADAAWEPTQGKWCDRCGYQRHCPAFHTHPEPLPETAKPPSQGTACVTPINMEPSTQPVCSR